jgi:telomerase reverse transcriptase
MARKRKRAGSSKSCDVDRKRSKINATVNGTSVNKGATIKHALLAKYYAQVFSLREYLLSKLPTASKVRRRKITLIGGRPEETEAEKQLSNFLDHTLIGVSRCNEVSQEERWEQWTTFSQKPDDSRSYVNVNGVDLYSQSEVCVYSLLCSLYLECLVLHVQDTMLT